MTYEEFTAYVNKNYTENRTIGGWRLGQSFFNCLFEQRPDLANEIRATPLDCFYMKHVPLATLTFVEKNWEKF
jgi:hypothetical protein